MKQEVTKSLLVKKTSCHYQPSMHCDCHAKIICHQMEALHTLLPGRKTNAVHSAVPDNSQYEQENVFKTFK